MFYRLRASLTERPGALALLASRCGEAGLNILGLRNFPDLGRLTDKPVGQASSSHGTAAVECDKPPSGLVARIGGHVAGMAAFAGDRERCR